MTHLLETTMIRIGNRQYAQENRTFGLSTLRTRHVKATGDELLFQFRGKSGKDWRVRVRDRRAARIVRACQELPGQHLFQYRDGDGAARAVSSQDVNGYLRAISGARVTAKDFRTWGATVLCALTLKDAASAPSSRALRRQIAAAVREVAGRLGNTPAICRACYIHPDILTAHADGELARRMARMLGPTTQDFSPSGALRPEEQAVLALLGQLARRKRKAAGAGPARVPAGARARRGAQTSAEPGRAAA